MIDKILMLFFYCQNILFFLENFSEFFSNFYFLIGYWLLSIFSYVELRDVVDQFYFIDELKVVQGD